MDKIKRYKTRPIACWQKAKELRKKYYEDYARAHENGGIRWSGGAEAMDAIVAGLGEDVYPLTSEPYAAAVASDPKFALSCQEAVEKKGYARDLCAYMRNYLGSMIQNRYLFGGEFPRPDFLWQDQFCCTHAKWFQVANELVGDIPYFGIDMSVGVDLGPHNTVKEHQMDYVVTQMHEGIEWLERTTGRKLDDERLIEAVYNDCESTSLWSEICVLNKAVPAPLDEKTMFSLYVFLTLHRSKREYVDFYKELRDEVKDRVNDQIAALSTERCRLMTDSQPPWSVLSFWRELEKYGAVSVGSIYTFALEGIWDVKEDWSMEPAQTPQQKGIVIKDREQALRVLAEWNLKKPIWSGFYKAKWKNPLMVKLAQDWKADGVILHLNRGCEGLGLHIMEARLALLEAGIPVVTYEGNMGDQRECDEIQMFSRIETFMEGLELKKLDD